MSLFGLTSVNDDEIEDAISESYTTIDLKNTQFFSSNYAINETFRQRNFQFSFVLVMKE